MPHRKIDESGFGPALRCMAPDPLSPTAGRLPSAAVRRRRGAMQAVIVADDPRRAALLQRAFARNMTRVRVALTAGERRRFLKQPAPHIVVLATERWDTTTTAILHELKQASRAHLVVLITSRPDAPMQVEVLRRQHDDFVRTASIALSPANWTAALWSWLAGVATTLCLELDSALRSGGDNG